MITLDQEQWLMDHGYRLFVDGEWALSTKAMALVGRVDESRFAKLLPTGHIPIEPTEELLGPDLLRDMRRGAQELVDEYGVDDMTEILYYEAVKHE